MARSAANHRLHLGPLLALDLGQGEQKIWRGGQFQRYNPQKRSLVAAPVTSTAPLDQVGRVASSIDFKRWNLGFHSCKDQGWFVALPRSGTSNPQNTPTGRCTSSSTAPLDQVGRAVVKVITKKLQEAAASLGGTWGFTSARTRCGSLHIAKEWNKRYH